MKNYIILIIIFVLFTAIAYSELFEIDLLGGTELNGSGCVCHTTERDTSVSVWIEGPDHLIAGQTGVYKMYLANGPAQAGGYNVAGRFGIMSLVDTLSVLHHLSPNELTQAFPLVFPTPQDTIYWEFAYTAPDSVLVDTLYSCGLSLVYDSIPDFHDRWNFGPKFPIIITEEIVPVELLSFTLSVSENNVTLNWITSTETNNMGFEIERFYDSKIERLKNWENIGFVIGNGTTTQTQTYLFSDINLNAGRYQYRLKQIDFDGTSEYSNIIETEIFIASDFILEQNYPNPFNPGTTIKYSIPNVTLSSSSRAESRDEGSRVQLKIYDILGNEVASLVNENKPAGNYEVIFNSQNLSSGVYFYKLSFGKLEVVKKMILMR
jgi:hypothetical protein